MTLEMRFAGNLATPTCIMSLATTHIWTLDKGLRGLWTVEGWTSGPVAMWTLGHFCPYWLQI